MHPFVTYALLIFPCLEAEICATNKYTENEEKQQLWFEIKERKCNECEKETRASH
jgi:hypothetical protein